MTDRTFNPAQRPTSKTAVHITGTTSKTTTGFERLLTPRDAAAFLHLSQSWLAKARMRGDGPPYVKIGRSIRYREAALVQWLKSKQRLSTTEQ